VRTLNGEAIDTRRYCRLVNSLGRVACQLGLARVPREIEIDDASVAHVWPAYRQDEAARQANAATDMAALIAGLESDADDEPVISDENNCHATPDPQEDPQP
jgi:hypothetical protein